MVKLEKRIIEYLNKRAREMGEKHAWVSSSNIVNGFDEIRSRNWARRILRQMYEDIDEIKDPRYKRRYLYGLKGWQKPTKTSLAARA